MNVAVPIFTVPVPRDLITSPAEETAKDNLAGVVPLTPAAVKVPAFVVVNEPAATVVAATTGDIPEPVDVPSKVSPEGTDENLT